MLVEARRLAERHQERKGRRRLYFPRIDWNKWLYSGDQEDESLPSRGRKAARQGALPEHLNDRTSLGLQGKWEISAPMRVKSDREVEMESRSVRDQSDGQPASGQVGSELAESRELNAQILLRKIRGTLADTAEWMQESEDLLYAVKLTIAAMLVTWPSFVPAWNEWYSLDRGSKFDGTSDVKSAKH